MENRISIALEFLKVGKSFSVGELGLSIDNFGCIVVRGWSRYLSFFNLNKKNSLQELEDIKYLFSEILKASLEFREFSEGKCIEFVLSFDDSGKASVDICKEKEGELIWVIQLP